MAAAAHEVHQDGEAVTVARIRRERLAAAEQEHRRYHDATGLAALALQQCSADAREIGQRVYELREQRDLERLARTIDEAVVMLAEVFTKSPIALVAVAQSRPF